MEQELVEQELHHRCYPPSHCHRLRYQRHQTHNLNRVHPHHYQRLDHHLHQRQPHHHQQEEQEQEQGEEEQEAVEVRISLP